MTSPPYSREREWHRGLPSLLPWRQTPLVGQEDAVQVRVGPTNLAGCTTGPSGKLIRNKPRQLWVPTTIKLKSGKLLRNKPLQLWVPTKIKLTNRTIGRGRPDCRPARMGCAPRRCSPCCPPSPCLGRPPVGRPRVNPTPYRGAPEVEGGVRPGHWRAPPLPPPPTPHCCQLTPPHPLLPNPLRPHPAGTHRLPHPPTHRSLHAAGFGTQYPRRRRQSLAHTVGRHVSGSSEQVDGVHLWRRHLRPAPQDGLRHPHTW